MAPGEGRARFVLGGRAHGILPALPSGKSPLLESVREALSLRSFSVKSSLDG